MEAPGRVLLRCSKHGRHIRRAWLCFAPVSDGRCGASVPAEFSDAAFRLMACAGLAWAMLSAAPGVFAQEAARRCRARHRKPVRHPRADHLYLAAQAVLRRRVFGREQPDHRARQELLVHGHARPWPAALAGRRVPLQPGSGAGRAVLGPARPGRAVQRGAGQDGQHQPEVLSRARLYPPDLGPGRRGRKSSRRISTSSRAPSTSAAWC